MPLTPNSSATSYLDPAGFLAFYDARIVGELVRDDNTQATPAELATDPTLIRHLQAASGRVESAAVRGGRYSPGDLLVLSGDSLYFLQGVVAALAMETLQRRRVDHRGLPSPDYADALLVLKQLESGESALAFAETEKAGVAKSINMTPREIGYLNLSTNTDRGRYFGSRGGPSGPGFGWGSD